jgi:hypothetical protein
MGAFMTVAAKIRKLAGWVPGGPLAAGGKAFLIFAAMVATPIVAHKILRSESLDLPNLAWIAVAIVVLSAIGYASYLPGYWQQSDRYDTIGGYLNRAERDMNHNINSGQSHGGRKSKVEERLGWSHMAESQGIQILNAGYRTPAHDIIQWNENDLAGKGAAMSRATDTALLLRELYEGSVNAARARIEAQVRNANTVPYLAPGMRELIGTHTYDKEKDVFVWTPGVDTVELQLVAKLRGFPSKNLIKGDLRGNDVLVDLTQQKP